MRPDLDLPRVVCEYLDVFLDELPGLPPHRMASVELQELRVKLRELLDKGLLDRALHHGALRF